MLVFTGFPHKLQIVQEVDPIGLRARVPLPGDPRPEPEIFVKWGRNQAVLVHGVVHF